MDTIAPLSCREVEQAPAPFHQSRFGFHPCSYETFQKLKALKKAYWQTAHQLADWFRWDRKEPQNRVIRKKIRNEVGQVKGYEDPIPRPEPKFLDMFISDPEMVKRHAGWKWRKDIPVYLIDKFVDLFEEARMPKGTREEVRMFGMLQLEEIDAYYKLLRDLPNV